MLDNRIDLSAYRSAGPHDDAQIGPVMDYWQRLRRGRPVPPRSEIDPAAIQPYLGQSGIVERTASGTVKLRLAGRRLDDLMGMDMRGMPLRAVFTVDHRARIEDLLAQVFDGPRLLTMTMTAAMDGQPLVTARMALMPLSDIEGRISRALMVLTPQANPAMTPCRFHIRHAHLARVTPKADTVPLRPHGARFQVIDGGIA